MMSASTVYITDHMTLKSNTMLVTTQTDLYTQCRSTNTINLIHRELVKAPWNAGFLADGKEDRILVHWEFLCL